MARRLDPRALREDAFAAAAFLTAGLRLPAGCALAATGSFARREMTERSDLDLILLHPEGTAVDTEEAASVWYPVWDAKYHLDYSVRTPRDCAQVAERDASAGFAQLDLAYVAGAKALIDEARAKLLATWRVQLQRNFDAFNQTAIDRWRRAGSVASMTKPDIKNGRGGLRDIQFIRALSLGNLCDEPDLTAQKELLLNVRTLLHHFARRHRDTLDPEFAADIAAELGFSDRYELSAALVGAAAAVEKSLERCLDTARGLVGRRARTSVRKPLDLDVVEAGGRVTLARNADLEDPVLALRVAAASARTGKPIDPGVWTRLEAAPQFPPHWSFPCVDAFFSILSFPAHTARVVAELDAHGWWERIVPEWGHIRGLLPRERSHQHTIDHHCILTTARCAEVRTTVARPDLLLLAALYHDIGKGYDRPHEQVGAELVARMAARMGLNLADCSRVQTLVAEHTTLARIVARMDPACDAARDELLSAVHFDPLTISLLKVLAKADALSTGPGVWNRRLEGGIEILTDRALAQVQALRPVPPRVHARPGISLRAHPGEKLLSIAWSGPHQRDLLRVLALLAARGWTVVAVRLCHTDNAAYPYAAELDVRTYQESFATAADEERFVQAYKSRVHSTVPPVAPGPVTATWTVGGVIEIRTPDRPYACAAALENLPECRWLSVTTLGATMIMQAAPLNEVPRGTVVKNVTAALGSG